MSDSTVTKLPAKPTDDKPAYRHGYAYVEEEEFYYLTGLARSALTEAKHLTDNIHEAAFERTTDRDGAEGAPPVNIAEAVTTISEARKCLKLADSYLGMLAREEPPPWAGVEPAF